MSVTGDQVLEAFKRDPRVTGADDPQLEMMEPFIRALPETLSDLLDELVNLERLFEAKLRFIRYCLDNGMLERVRTFMGGVLGDSLDETVEELREGLSDLAKQLETAAPQLGETLRAQGITEIDALVSPEVGLNVDMVVRLTEGSLTFDVLLANQPGVIIVNES